jgi:phytoene dehydrogenase-like protein
MSAPEVVVVGGGLAGLAGAAYLARGGARVVLLEKAADLGGRSRSREEHGFVFNLGPHALYKKGAGLRTLRDLGVAVDGREPAGGFAVSGGKLHALPVGIVSLWTTTLLGFGARVETGRLLARFSRIDSAPFARTSARLWLEREAGHPETRDLFAAFLRLATYAKDLERMSAGVAIRQLQMAIEGVLYLHGGWQTLVNGLARKAREAGARLETGVAVASLLTDGGRVQGVRLSDGTVREAPFVLAAVDPRTAAALSGSAFELGSPIPVRAACLDLALRSLPRPDRLFALGIDAPTYLSVHSATARLAPPGAALVHALRALDEGERAGEDAGRDLEALVDLVQPGWRDVLVQRRFAPSLVVSNALPEAARGGSAGRPPVEVRRAPGLFVAGDWVGAEGLLADASLASARLAAEAILARIREARPAA